MKVDWSNQIVLITGASSGIGGALAVELGRRGAALGLFARRADELMKVAEEIERGGGKALVLPGDVRQSSEIEKCRLASARTMGTN
ncbi:MAG: SDR family NAD(P)-dependent oxidoreductase [Pyrinomonadaceae bacterium]|nr:SDR family NAD(P)-dependent oxidoreductase [Pyrinomonadaceae bacterium]